MKLNKLAVIFGLVASAVLFSSAQACEHVASTDTESAIHVLANNSADVESYAVEQACEMPVTEELELIDPSDVADEAMPEGKPAFASTQING
ncbi:MAG: hypothetical protein OEW58_12670 [Gammaproteobacteria bacterium]|nr:hypothetical protein [Gammaproteobacteria bacterium]